PRRLQFTQVSPALCWRTSGLTQAFLPSEVFVYFLCSSSVLFVFRIARFNYVPASISVLIQQFNKFIFWNFTKVMWYVNVCQCFFNCFSFVVHSCQCMLQITDFAQSEKVSVNFAVFNRAVFDIKTHVDETCIKLV